MCSIFQVLENFILKFLNGLAKALSFWKRTKQRVKINHHGKGSNITAFNMLTARICIPRLNMMLPFRQAVSTQSTLRWCKYVTSWCIICKTTRLLISMWSWSISEPSCTRTFNVYCSYQLAFISLACSSRLSLMNAGICLFHSISLRSAECTPLKRFWRLGLSAGLKSSCCQHSSKLRYPVG